MVEWGARREDREDMGVEELVLGRERRSVRGLERRCGARKDGLGVVRSMEREFPGEEKTSSSLRARNGKPAASTMARVSSVRSVS